MDKSKVPRFYGTPCIMVVIMQATPDYLKACKTRKINGNEIYQCTAVQFRLFLLLGTGLKLISQSPGPTGCYCPHPPSPLSSTLLYLKVNPREKIKLSWPEHCSTGVQPVLRGHMKILEPYFQCAKSQQYQDETFEYNNHTPLSVHNPGFGFF